MSHVDSETNEVSTARSDQWEEYQSIMDTQLRLDGIQLGEEDYGEKSLVEMTALDEVTSAALSISIISTGYDGSVTAFTDSSMENLTDDLMSFYSDHEETELEVECPSYFYVSSVGKAVAMDSIEALDKLADFTPIPVDFTGVVFDSLDLPIPEKLDMVAEHTARAGDTDSTSTCPYQENVKDAAITERADLTSYCLAPSQTDVTVAAVDEGLVENDEYSTVYVESSERMVEMTDGAKSPALADMTVYTMPKSEREVEVTESPLSEDFCSIYSIEGSEVERCVEMMDTHSSYTEGPSEIECGL